MKTAELFRLIEMTMRLFEKKRVFLLGEFLLSSCGKSLTWNERGEKEGGTRRDFDTSADVITRRRRRLLLLLLLLPRIDCHIKTVQKVGYEICFSKLGNGGAATGTRNKAGKKRNWDRFWQIGACLVTVFFFEVSPLFYRK